MHATTTRRTSDDESRCQYCQSILWGSEIDDECCDNCLYGMSEEEYEKHEHRRITKLYPFLKHVRGMSLADLHDAERDQKRKG